jgi:hypothetical protein
MMTPILLVSLGEDASLEIRHQLELEPLIDSGSSPNSLWISYGHLPHKLAALRGLLRIGAIRSAALLPEVPPRDHLWIIEEWRGRLVINEDLLPILEEQRGWKIESRNKRFNLLILSPGNTEEKRSQVQEVESPEEYERFLFSERPVFARLGMAALESPRAWREWFGELAEPEIGGAVALLALSGARPDSSEILLRNPAALGLKVIRDDPSTLSTYCRRKKLEVVAYGGSWGKFEQQTMAFEQEFSRRRHHDYPMEEIMGQAHGELLHAHRSSQGTNYFILLGVEAIDDPEVVIPTGAIFEQSSLNGVQTLAAANPRKFQIDVGQFLPIALPAWCLNRSLSPPAGEPVRPTPLVYPGGGGGQGAVWDDIAQRLSEASL